MKAANIVRVILGMVFLAGAATNAFLAMTQPSVYAPFADVAIIPLFRNLWQSLVVPHLRFWLVLVVLLEVTTGILILSKGMWVKVGLAGAILFCLFLVPFWWEGGAIVNIVFAAILVWLLFYDYDASLIDLVRRKRSRPQA